MIIVFPKSPSSSNKSCRPGFPNFEDVHCKLPKTTVKKKKKKLARIYTRPTVIFVTE
jgi:hypothetical protein